MKTDYRKIDIFVACDGAWRYVASTTWSRTCRDAKARYFATHPGIHIDRIKCSFSRKG